MDDLRLIKSFMKTRMQIFHHIDDFLTVVMFFASHFWASQKQTRQDGKVSTKVVVVDRDQLGVS